jgi:hypothetical protein
VATKTKTKAESSRLIEDGSIGLPYSMTLHLRGVTPFLFNRMDIETYDAEPAPEKTPRRRPAYESMVWRDENGLLAVPTENVVASIVSAGKYFKTPLGSSGSATQTLVEALVPLGEFASFGVESWDTIDFRRARNADRKRSPKPTYRPRLEVGWACSATFSVNLPELYGPAKLLEIASRAGSVMGVGDGRRIGMGRYVLDGHETSEGLPW